MSKLWSMSRRFSENQSGSVAIMFALSAAATIFLLGASIDFTRSSMVRARLQAASDATILALARQGSLSGLELSARATQLFATNIGGDPNARIVAGPDHRNNGVELCIDTMTTANASFMQMAKVDAITVRATACAAVSDAFYEIALVLDNSGSMSEWAGATTKINGLKSAAAAMLDKLAAAGGTSAVAAYSIVPFAASVNIGPQYRTAPFMDRYGQSAIHWQNIFNPVVAGASWRPQSRFDIYDKLFNAADFASGTAWSGCVEERPGDLFLSDAPADPTLPNSLYVPMFAPDEPYGADNSYLSDSGGSCVAGDAYEQKDIADGAGSGRSKMCKYNVASKLSKSYASYPNKSCTSKPLLPLTLDVASAKSAISDLAASGNTNITSGLLWGWRTISPATPFMPALTTSTGQQTPTSYGGRTGDGRLVKKVIVLMTDGDNTWGSNAYSYYRKLAGGGTSYASIDTGRYGPFGYWQNARMGYAPTGNSGAVEQMDDTVKTLCGLIKNKGVTIYTVGFGSSISANGKAILQACASDPDKYFTPNSDVDIVATFQTIADSLQILRLTR